MSLLRRHSLLGHRKTPSRIRITGTFITPLSATYTTGALPVPAPGNLIILSAGGSQNRGITTHPGGGLNYHAPSNPSGIGGTMGIWWKIADGTEPAGGYTIVWSGGTLAGGWMYQEWTDIDLSQNPPWYQDIYAGSPFTNTLVFPSFSVNGPGVTLSFIVKGGSTGWNPDNGFTVNSFSGQHKGAHKIYNAIDLSESVIWSGTAEMVRGNFYSFRGRKT